MSANLGTSLLNLLDAIQEARIARAVATDTAFPHVPLTYVTLGSLTYELTGPLNAFEAQHEYNYAEHAVIEGKPVLQAIGDGLEELTLTLGFHSALTDPDLELAALRALATEHQAVPLTWANGAVRGRYVVTAIDQTIEQTDAQGNIIAASARVTLKEFVEDQLLEVEIKRPVVHNTAKTKQVPPPPVADDDDLTMDELLRRTRKAIGESP